MPPTAKPPATLGDSVYVIRRERFDLPERPAIGKMVQTLVDEGGIQKIFLQVGQPVLVERLVPQSKIDKAAAQEIDDVPIPEVKDDFYFAIRNAEMEELQDGDKYSALEALFRAFVLISHRRFKPIAFVVHNTSGVCRWLKVDQLFGLEELFGVPIIVNTAIPESSVILASGDEGMVDFSVRIPVSDK